MEVKSISCKVGGSSISFETGKLAKQANSAVVARVGDTVVLATVVMSKKPKEGKDFFPLLIDYEERLYAAGKIKGSRWVKREGRATEEAILTGRVIDRTLRPLFPYNMRNDVQIILTVLSIDGENDADMVALNAAAMALHISDIPFDGPVAGVRVAKVDGHFLANPTNSEREKSVLDLIVSGTGEHIMMVEAGAALVSEEDIVEAIRFAQTHLGALAKVQTEFRGQSGQDKVVVPLEEVAPEIAAYVKSKVSDEEIEKTVYVKVKDDRDNGLDALFDRVTEKVEVELADWLAANPGVKAAGQARNALDTRVKKYIQKQILEHDRRVDGRALTETRQVSCEVGVLPRTHGSALFSRGETQVLTVVTLGSKSDEQTLDGMEDPQEGRAKRYIHHYNMAGFSVGEVAPVRGPGRREIGHGALAERAVEQVLPVQDEFPYTMRLVSETMSSNGSTSMASTCGSTLALMDAGVPIKHVVGGVAMGLVMDESDTSKFKVLTDIAGIEDFNGHMDFKVTGSEEGITALQLDIKVKGLTWEILARALEQAKPGRLHIISKMKEVLSAPRAELSQYAPRITSFRIEPDKIREVIGSGGKVINGIIAECPGVKIDIEDDGLVMVVSTDAEMAAKAVGKIKDIVREVLAGEEFDGTVTRLMNFGAFVEVLPGKEGLVHISELANYHVGQVEDVVKVGDKLKVKVKEIDDQGRINLTHKPYAAPAPEGQAPEHGFDWKPNGSRGGHGGGHSGGGRPSFGGRGGSRGGSRGDHGGGGGHSRPRY